MIDISQATSMLTSMGVSGTLAASAAQRTAQQFSNADPLTFLKELRATLAELSTSGDGMDPSVAATAASNTGTDYKATAALYSGNAQSKPVSAKGEASTLQVAKAPFSNLEEFKKWESKLGATFAADYKPPDYVRVASMTLSGGNDTVVGRYMFFKNHPEFAADYEAIRSGHLSKFPTDGSTLIKSDLSKMSPETAEYYKKNPAELLAAEGFNMDPTLAKMRMAGEVNAPTGTSVSDWLMDNKWTKEGIVAQNNRLVLAQSDYIGIDGKGAGTYRLGKYDSGTGNIINPDGLAYDPLTGEAKA